MEELFLRLLSFAAVGASGTLLDCISILCLSEAQALDVPSLVNPSEACFDSSGQMLISAGKQQAMELASVATTSHSCLLSMAGALLLRELSQDPAEDGCFQVKRFAKVLCESVTLCTNPKQVLPR